MSGKVLYRGGLFKLVRRMQGFKQSIPYQIGIEGEETLRKKLRQYLSDEYSVFYNISTGHGDIDCVIVGPSGVLALEMKNYVGKVFYSKEGLWGRFRRNSRGTVDRLPISNPSGQLLKTSAYLKTFCCIMA